ncbi:GTPase HflX [bacterium]|nr:GTPase HflX [bacterium]
MREHRSRHRAQRRRAGVPVVALAGYTNAGKSTLLKAMTDADIYIADQLFATLDPTTRRIGLESGREVLLTDTVGFIQKLPTTLIAAFRATLEEILEANLLLHVVDVSHPNVTEHIEAVEDTLAEIDVPNMPRVLVWNKMDRWSSLDLPDCTTPQIYAAQVCVSAKTGQGVDGLLKVIEDVLSAQLPTARLLIPYERGDLVALLYASGNVEQQENTDEGVIITAQLPHSLYNKLQVYRLLE